MRVNEFRRVGYPTHIRGSRFRFFGTEASFEQLGTTSLWQDKEGVTDVSDELATSVTMATDDPALANVAPAFSSQLSATKPSLPMNAWEAARYTFPGIVAHKSALQGGARLSIPDPGDARTTTK